MHIRHATHPQLINTGHRFARIASKPPDDPGAALPWPELVRFKHELDREPCLRWLIDGTKHLGHQSSSLNALFRLIEVIDYHGRIEVYYVDDNPRLLGDTTGKLDHLIPELQRQGQGSFHHRHAGAQLHFQRLQAERSPSVPVRFGVTCGADRMDINYARVLNVDTFLRLQPYLWDDLANQRRDPFFVSSRLECRDGRQLYLCDAWPALRQAPLALATAHEQAALLSDNDNDNDNDRQVWPVYGLHHFVDHSHRMALRIGLCAAVLCARHQSPLQLIFCCPLAQQRPWRQKVTSMLRGIVFTPAEWQRLWLETVGRDPGVSSSDTAPGAPAVMTSERQQPHVGSMPALVLVFAGPSPPGQYRAWLSSSRLPAVLEGLASINEALQHGSPCLQLLRAEFASKSLCEQLRRHHGQAPLIKRLAMAARALQAPPSASADTTPATIDSADLLAVRLLLSICEDLSRPSSPLDRLFREHHAWATRPQRDKLLLGLLALAIHSEEEAEDGATALAN